MKKIDGRYLKGLREQRGYSLREFADMIYASKSSVQRWEKSFVPENDDLLKRIAEVFDISVGEMYTQSDLKYGPKAKDQLTAEQLAELKFGIKRLIPLFLFLGLAAVATVTVIIVMVYKVLYP